MGIQSRSLAVKPAVLAPTALPANTEKLATKQMVTDITSLNRGNDAVTPLYNNKVIGFFSVPPKITVTVENTNIAGGDLEVNIFNQNSFNAPPAGVNVTYSTGFSGKSLEQLIRSINNGNGLMLYGFNITGYNSAGVKSDTVINESAIEARYYNLYGNSYLPVQIDVAGAERNTQFKDGLLTVKVLVMLNALMQLKMNLGQGEKLQFVFFTKPIED